MADKVDRIYESMRCLPALKSMVMDHHLRINALEKALGADDDATSTRSLNSAFPVEAEPSGSQSQPENPPAGKSIYAYFSALLYIHIAF